MLIRIWSGSNLHWTGLDWDWDWENRFVSVLNRPSGSRRPSPAFLIIFFLPSQGIAEVGRLRPTVSWSVHTAAPSSAYGRPFFRPGSPPIPWRRCRSFVCGGPGTDHRPADHIPPSAPTAHRHTVSSVRAVQRRHSGASQSLFVDACLSHPLIHSHSIPPTHNFVCPILLECRSNPTHTQTVGLRSMECMIACAC